MHTTLPDSSHSRAPVLWRVSAFRRALPQAESPSRFTSLSPSLLADLQRFEALPEGAETLEVMAACLRHPQNVALLLDRDGHVVPLTVFPRERMFHTPLPLASVLGMRMDSVRVLQVEPALLHPPGDADRARAASAERCHPLGPLLWHLALHGSRHELLPELAGPAVYRIAPGLDLPQRPAGAIGAAIARLERQAASLRVIAGWPGFDRERAMRLLNGLYLQPGGLIVSRSHPMGARDSWFGSLGR
ncbi:MAG TPA: hypothetical protein VN680_18030 [Burkholderiaceae bacterium]|jgi:hypothetical protein|nr:hypothetical protein [Burkholderiaceae bacterium]